MWLLTNTDILHSCLVKSYLICNAGQEVNVWSQTTLNLFECRWILIVRLLWQRGSAYSRICLYRQKVQLYCWFKSFYGIWILHESIYPSIHPSIGTSSLKRLCRFLIRNYLIIIDGFTDSLATSQKKAFIQALVGMTNSRLSALISTLWLIPPFYFFYWFKYTLMCQLQWVC